MKKVIGTLLVVLFGVALVGCSSCCNPPAPCYKDCNPCKPCNPCGR